MKKSIALIFLLVSFSTLATDFNLRGLWSNPTAGPEEKPVRFIQVDGVYHAHTQERFVYPNGQLAYTIDQAVKVTVGPEGKVAGTVDFYDSRGCSFHDYKVKGEFQHEDAVGLLMTVPRYKMVTITAGNHYRRPMYCVSTSPYYPYVYRYICGYDQGHLSITRECQLVDKVQVPVELERR